MNSSASIDSNNPTTSTPVESEPDFRALCESAPTGIFIMSADGRCEYLNRHARDMAGLDVLEEIGKDCLIAVHPMDRERVRDEWTAALRDTRDFDSTLRLRRADGGARWAHVKAARLQDHGDNPRFVGVMEDITARQRAEEERKATQLELQQQTQRLDELLSAVPGVVWEASCEPDAPTQQIHFVSESVQALLGYSVEEWLSTPNFWLAIVHPKDRERAMRRAAEIFAGSADIESEFRWITKDGRELWTKGHASVIRDPSGKPVGMRGINLVTQPRNADEAAGRHEEMLQTIFDHIPMMITYRDREGRLQIVNHEWERALGWSLAEAQATDITAQLYPLVEERERVEAFIRKADGAPGDFQICTRSGKTLQTQWITVRLSDGTSIGLGRDVSESKAANDAMRSLAAETRLLLESTSEGIYGIDNDNRCTFINTAAAAMIGYTPAEVLGRDMHDLLHHSRADGEPYPHDACPIMKGLQNNERCRVDTEVFWRKDGRMFPIEYSTNPIIENGVRRGAVIIFSDITERKERERHFLRAQRMESIGTLAGGIAHDLNNILCPIMTSFELLKMRFPEPENQELLAIVASSAQRGADMVRQVLSFARGVEGRRMELQVRHLVREVEKIANETLLKHIEVTTIVPHDLWSVVGDPTQLHQVLLNLCVNARDAMPNGGKLIISAENRTLDEQYAGLNREAKPGPYVFIQVEDSGTGIPPEFMDKIFDPFFTTKEVGKGTGLGLSTSMGIVKSHGGFMQVYSELEKGTKFCVYLPALTEAFDSPVPEVTEKPRGNGELILVVDDESAARQITQQTLQAFGYRVLLAADGAEAVALYAAQSAEIAVVLTDMTMPVMDGTATIQVLRKMNPAVRVIAASGLASHGRATNASLDVKHFLSKPYTAEVMLKVLRDILSHG